MTVLRSYSQGYTLAEEEEDPLIFQHRQLRSNQSDTLVSGPVESGPMKKLHVSTTALQKVRMMTCHRPTSPTHIAVLVFVVAFAFPTGGWFLMNRPHNYTVILKPADVSINTRRPDENKPALAPSVEI